MKTNKMLIFSGLLLAMLSIGLTSCAKDDEAVVSPSIVEIATSNADFSILAQALVKADLVNTINASENLTVFAPTNAAFNALFSQLGVSGLSELPAATLKPILLYHVLGGKVTSGQITPGYAYTLSPGKGNKTLVIKIDTQSGVTINKTTSVTQADIMASNGVIHVIDKVLLPVSIVDIALNDATFSTLVAALVKAELVETLKGDGPFTVFAPTNDAFTALFTTLGVSGIADLTKEQLVPILLYHVVSGNVLSTSLSSGNVATLNPKPIVISVGSGVTINTNASVVAADVQGNNGVIHVINKVLVPPTN
jgi:transforming growth factor-beta-induced protein